MAVILAGGEGERLSILSSMRAKPAVPFGGKYRIIDFVLSNCVNSGIDNVVVLTQYNPRSLNDHIGLGRPWAPARNGGGIRMLQPYISRGRPTEWYRGTADAVLSNIDAIRQAPGDLVLVLAGDHIYKMDYGPFVQAHRRHRADVTVAVRRGGPRGGAPPGGPAPAVGGDLHPRHARRRPPRLRLPLRRLLAGRGHDRELLAGEHGPAGRPSSARPARPRLAHPHPLRGTGAGAHPARGAHPQKPHQPRLPRRRDGRLPGGGGGRAGGAGAGGGAPPAGERRSARRTLSEAGVPSDASGIPGPAQLDAWLGGPGAEPLAPAGRGRA